MTYVETKTLWRKSGPVRVWVELHALKLSFILSFIIFDFFGLYIQMFTDIHKWHLDQLYAAIFGFSAIEIGGLLALYMLLASDTPITRKMGNTHSFKRYVTFVKMGIWVSGIVSLLSLPVLVIDPSLNNPIAFSTILASIWYALSISMFIALFRVISIAPMLIESWTQNRD